MAIKFCGKISKAGAQSQHWRRRIQKRQIHHLGHDFKSFVFATDEKSLCVLKSDLSRSHGSHADFIFETVSEPRAVIFFAGCKRKSKSKNNPKPRVPCESSPAMPVSRATVRIASAPTSELPCFSVKKNDFCPQRAEIRCCEKRFSKWIRGRFAMKIGFPHFRLVSNWNHATSQQVMKKYDSQQKALFNHSITATDSIISVPSVNNY